jgi:LPXTG-motif cell wall-anchored protein
VTASADASTWIIPWFAIVVLLIIITLFVLWRRRRRARSQPSAHMRSDDAGKLVSQGV